MSRVLNIRPEAESDIAVAFDWYETEYSGLGVQFFDTLSESFERITSNPLHYADLGQGIRRKLLQKFPYAVFFVLDRGEIWVLAVLQQSQSPDIWKSRK